MKKELLACFMAAFTLCGVVSSCSDDEDPLNKEPEAPVTPETPETPETFAPIVTEETVFSGETLKMTYSKSEVLGKQVKFTPDVNDDTKATLEIAGSKFFLLGEESRSLDLTAALPTPGIIPGELTTKLEVSLTNTETASTFEGEDKNAQRTIKYSGKATKEGLTLDLDVTMADNALVNKTLKMFFPKDGKADFAPLLIDWQIEKSWGFDFDGDGKDDTYQENAFALFSPMFLLNLIESKLTISQYLEGVFEKVTFLPDGNIQASYKDSYTDAAFKSSPLNLASYEFVKNGQIKLYLNPEMIEFVSSKAKSRAEGSYGILTIIQQFLNISGLVSSAVQDGIIINYEATENGYYKFMLDEESISLPLLQSVTPLLNDPELLDMLKNLVIENFPKDLVDSVTPEKSWDIINNVIKSMPESLKSTVYVQFGMLFTFE